MLYVLYIYDILEGVDSEMRIFTDDTTAYRQIYTPPDHVTLESAINKLSNWANTKQVDFNVSQCAILSVTTQEKQIRITWTLSSTQHYRGNRTLAEQHQKDTWLS